MRIAPEFCSNLHPKIALFIPAIFFDFLRFPNQLLRFEMTGSSGIKLLLKID